MPLYYFNFRSGERSEPCLDDEGIDLPDLSAAREEAIGGARDIAADRVRSGAPLDLDALIDIADGDRNTLLTVTFREALVMKL